MNWLARWKFRHRLKKKQCPFCGQAELSATFYDGEAKRPSLFCPELHHGYIYTINYDTNKASFRELAAGGEIMNIPEEYIIWKHEMLADQRR